MGGEIAEASQDAPKPKTPEDEAAKKKAPEKRENEETITVRKTLRELQQKVKDALELGTTQNMKPEGKMALIRDFMKTYVASLSDNARAALKQLNAGFIFPDKVVDEFRTAKWGQGKPIYETFVYQVSLNPSLDPNISLVNNPALNSYQDYYASVKDSDAGKAPKESPSTIDRPPSQVMAELNQKAADAKAQFSGSGGRKAESTYMQALNDFISDAYSRYTTSEKASVAGKSILSDVDINRRSAEGVGNSIAGHFTARVNFFSNNYIIKPA